VTDITSLEGSHPRPKHYGACVERGLYGDCRVDQEEKLMRPCVAIVAREISPVAGNSFAERKRRATYVTVQTYPEPVAPIQIGGFIEPVNVWFY